jgi:diguanylate cyclase (GGDEF)-like protein
MREFSYANWDERAGRAGAPGSPALRAALVVAVAVAGDSLVRCLRRTSRLAEETRRLAELSRTDGLTELSNRLHLEEQLAAAVSASRRHGHPLSVLFIDIDSFKHINDAFGYEAGDEVLRAVADRLRATIRTEDVLGRWGGEEFVVILPATDLAGGVTSAERLRDAIDGELIVVAGIEVHVTVSVGCATDGRDPADLIRQASRALRQAKLAGRNRVVAADPAS